MNNRIKMIRKDVEETLAVFGKKIGVSPAAISQIEKGKNGVSEQTIKTICYLYNVNENWLRTGEGSMHGDRSKMDEIADITAALYGMEQKSLQYRITKLFAMATPKQMEIFNDFLDQLLDKDGE